MEHCLNLEKALQHGDSKDIDAVDLSSELKAISDELHGVHRHRMY